MKCKGVSSRLVQISSETVMNKQMALAGLSGRNIRGFSNSDCCPYPIVLRDLMYTCAKSPSSEQED